MLPTEPTDGQLQARQDAGQAGAGACVCFCAHPLRHRRRSDRAHNPAHVCLCSGTKPAQGTPARQAPTEDAEAGIILVNASARAQDSPRPTTSPGDIAGRCTALAVALVSVTASVPPVTTAAPRRTRRSPPRVLFLECAGSCTCSCLLPAPAPRPTIDPSQGPVSRPGVSAATGLHRMSARPTIQAGQHAPAKLRRCKARALRNTTRPLPRQRSHSRLNPSEVLHSDGTTAGASTARPSHAPAPPYHPTEPTDSQLQSRQDTGRSTSPTPGGPALHPRPRFTRPRPPLGPPKRAGCHCLWSAYGLSPMPQFRPAPPE